MKLTKDLIKCNTRAEGTVNRVRKDDCPYCLKKMKNGQSLFNEYVKRRMYSRGKKKETPPTNSPTNYRRRRLLVPNDWK